MPDYNYQVSTLVISDLLGIIPYYEAFSNKVSIYTVQYISVLLTKLIIFMLQHKQWCLGFLKLRIHGCFMG